MKHLLQIKPKCAEASRDLKISMVGGVNIPEALDAVPGAKPAKVSGGTRENVVCLTPKAGARIAYGGSPKSWPLSL